MLPCYTAAHAHYQQNQQFPPSTLFRLTRRPWYSALLQLLLFLLPLLAAVPASAVANEDLVLESPLLAGGAVFAMALSVRVAAAVAHRKSGGGEVEEEAEGGGGSSASSEQVQQAQAIF